MIVDRAILVLQNLFIASKVVRFRLFMIWMILFTFSVVLIVCSQILPQHTYYIEMKSPLKEIGV